MGTRHAIIVTQNNQVKVGQYGQWDGYPSGQGLDLLRILQKFDMKKFAGKVEKLRFLTDKECEKIDKINKWSEKYPYLSRDASVDVLNGIYYGKMIARIEKRTKTGIDTIKKEIKCKILGLVDQSKFAADSLFCEYAYVIDLDKGTLECYRGFNKRPLKPGDRFYYLQEQGKKSETTKFPTKLMATDYKGYFPVKLAATFKLNDLPSEEKFLKDFPKNR